MPPLSSSLTLLLLSTLALDLSSTYSPPSSKLFYFPLRVSSPVACAEAASAPGAHGVTFREGHGKLLRQDYQLIQDLLQRDGGHFRLCDCRRKKDDQGTVTCKNIMASVNLVFRMELVEDEEQE